MANSHHIHVSRLFIEGGKTTLSHAPTRCQAPALVAVVMPLA